MPIVYIKSFEPGRANPNVLLVLQVPGIYKIRYVGQTTLSSAAVSESFLARSLQGVRITTR